MSNRHLNRRGFLRAGLAAAGMVPLASLCLSAKPESRKPNIILIMADDVGYECFGCYGSRQYKTPRIDQMAAGGVRFTNCHSTPLCTPSRVKIMTGRDNVRNYYNFGTFPKGQTTFAHVLKTRGYQTAFAGKWQLELVSGLFPKDVGFDNVCRLIGEWPKYWNTPIALNDKALPVEKNTYGPDRFTAFATDFIKRHKSGDKPFLLYFPMTLVHSPFEPTPGSKNRKSRKSQSNFEDMVAHMDTCIGRILDALKEAGLSDNTVVLFTGDNGTDASLRSTLNGEIIRGGKGHTKDHGTHVPLIVAGSGSPAGKVCDDLIDFSDFLPTLADIAGADLPKGVELDGRTFWPQCQGRKGHPRQWLFNYYFPRPYVKKYDKKYRHSEIRWVRNKEYKLYGDGRFYNVLKDVLEQKPLSPGDAPATRRSLQKVLDSMPGKGANIDYNRTHM
ncbi:MAG: sulfatase-like hydrolase/transferase [Phycisphaerae bacterium]|nr:sulfatase-like hydrolase/transferase [Phycisphaerae bacterium]